jgi:DNA-binding CsgD family transcriptional regulator
MEDDSLARLTEAQRQVLRLWHVRKSAKEIGRELGITHWAVNERLRSARRLLRVGSSGEAARILASVEEGDPYKRLVYDPPAIAPGDPAVVISAPDDTHRSSRGCLEPAVSEGGEPDRAWFLPVRPRWPLPRFRGDRNDLSLSLRLLWIGLLAVGIAVTVAALVLLARGAVGTWSEIRHGLS